MNRGDLKTKLANDYLHRSDLDQRLDGFIDLATARIGRNLRSPENTVIETVSIASTPYTLPSTYREMARVQSEADRGPIILRSVPSQRLARFTSTGSPAVYNVAAYQLSIAPFRAGDFTLEYWVQPAALTLDTSENDVLTAYPYLYIYAALAEAHISLQDYEQANQVIGVYETEIRQLNRQAENARAGDAPAAIGI